MAAAAVLGYRAQGGPGGSIVTLAHVITGALTPIVAVFAIASKAAVWAVVTCITCARPLLGAGHRAGAVITAAGVVLTAALTGKDPQQHGAGNGLFSRAARITAAQGIHVASVSSGAATARDFPVLSARDKDPNQLVGRHVEHTTAGVALETVQICHQIIDVRVKGVVYGPSFMGQYRRTGSVLPR